MGEGFTTEAKKKLEDGLGSIERRAKKKKKEGEKRAQKKEPSIRKKKKEGAFKNKKKEGERGRE